MMSLTDRLVRYADAHRDRRNLAAHFIGIPMITVAVYALWARWEWFTVGGVLVTPALILFAGTLIYYFRLDWRFAVPMLFVKGALVWLAYAIAALPVAEWLGWSIGLFVAGWILQFVGHYLEGKKPSIVNDRVAPYIGPLFLMAEAAFAVGLCPDLRRAVEAQAGPTMLRERVV